jgi:hypothetical protein
MEKNKGRDYQYLLEHFGEEKIRERTAFLIKTAELLIKNLEVENYILINNELLEQAVIDYFADVKRLKDFHGMDKVDCTKIAAYMAHWVLKRKPLQIKASVSEETYTKMPFLLDINEWFASYILISMLLDMNNRLVTDLEILTRWNNFNLTLIYFLIYRIVSPQTLELATVAVTITPPYKMITEGSD